MRSSNSAPVCISLSVLSLTEIWDNFERKGLLAAGFCVSLSVVPYARKSKLLFKLCIIFFIYIAPVSQSLPTNPVAQSHLKLFRRY